MEKRKEAGEEEKRVTFYPVTNNELFVLLLGVQKGDL